MKVSSQELMMMEILLLGRLKMMILSLLFSKEQFLKETMP